MKYTLEEIKDKIETIRKEYSVVEEFFRNQNGWVGQNFDSHKLLGHALYFVESWIKDIETNNANMTDGWGTTPQEMMDSFFGHTLSNCINPHCEIALATPEKDKIFTRLLLEIGVPGYVDYHDETGNNIQIFDLNIFADCIYVGNFKAFDELILNTDKIPIHAYYKILTDENIPSMTQLEQGYEEALDECLIALLERVDDKHGLLDLIKNGEGLIISNALQSALDRIELELTLPIKTEPRRKIKI